MNKIPKCNINKKILPLKITKKSKEKSVCGKIKMKLLTNQPIIKAFGRDITNISKNKDINKVTKKSSSFNEKVSINKYKMIYILFFQNNKKINVLANNIININNKRKSTMNKCKNNLSSNNSNTLRGKKILTWERKSIDSKQPKKKEKINISINSINNNKYKLEKINLNSNHLQKNNAKSSRPNSLLNNKRLTAFNTNKSINILKKSINKNKDYYSNKLTFSNPNLK